MAARVRWETGCLLVNVGCLGAVILARVFGVGVHRFRTAALFLILGTSWALYAELTFHLCRNRSRRQREDDVPRGVLLRTPLWIQVGGPISLLAAAAPVAALAGGLGSGQVGMGVLLAVVVVMATVGYFVMRYSCWALTFEDGALRLHLPGLNFLVPWTSIASVDLVGEGEWKLVQLTFFETSGRFFSVQPDTPRARERVALVIHSGDGLPGRIMLDRWAAGFDASPLAGAIRAQMKGVGPVEPN